MTIPNPFRQSKANDPAHDPISGPREELTRLGGLLMLALLVAAAAGFFATSEHSWLRSCGTIVLVGLVGLAIGAVLGFLFGIPRTMTGNAPTPVAPVAPGGTPGNPPAPGSPPGSAAAAIPVAAPGSMKTNTNLEDVSDWLTKIIVGVGLTQLHQLQELLKTTRDFIAGYFPAGDPTPFVAILVLIFTLVGGFLWLYLETRTILAQVLARFNDAMSKRDIGVLSDTISNIVGALPGGGSELAGQADSLKAALAIRPNNEALRTTTVTALAAAGRPDEAKAMLSGSDAARSEVAKMLIELYRPQGYIEVLKLSAALSNDAEATSIPDYWVYTAAAFGQKYKWLLAIKADPQEIQSTRDNVMDCVRKAVSLDPAEKVRLYWLAHPEKSLTPYDDDLVNFQNDPEFLAIVGNPPDSH